jgi:hypothetical protein
MNIFGSPPRLTFGTPKRAHLFPMALGAWTPHVELRHDTGTGNTVTKWSRVSSGTGTVLEWPYLSNTAPVFTGLCVLYGYCTLHVFTL